MAYADAVAGPTTYDTDIRQVNLLTAEEERSLGATALQGNRDARDRLVATNLRLVITIARTFLGRGLTLDDLIGEGNLGLIRAAQRYNPRFGARFGTYAAYWIKEAIRHALVNTTATVRLPDHVVGLLAKWRRAERTLRLELGEVPGFDRVANHLGLTEAQRSMMGNALQTLQVGAIGSIEEGAGWQEATDGCPLPETELEAAEEQREVRQLLDRLDARERLVVSLRFGLGGEDPQTLKATGTRVGVTREWIRKLLTAA